jgi:thymidylate synthase
MTALVGGTSVSRAWLAAVQVLLEVPNGQCSNLAVSIDSPTTEDAAIRRELDDFITAVRRDPRRRTRSVETVAATIFPSAFYRPAAKDPESHLYEWEAKIRPAVRRDPANTRGTYFERLVAYPGPDGKPYNQLHHVLEKLRWARAHGWRNGNFYELALFHPERDPQPEGFPCLSHVSITLADGRLDAAALYRNQTFVSRAYGNFVGLGSLLNFLAAESGFAVGELLCVASHADLESDKYTKKAVQSLVLACESALKETR